MVFWRIYFAWFLNLLIYNGISERAIWTKSRHFRKYIFLISVRKSPLTYNGRDKPLFSRSPRKYILLWWRSRLICPPLTSSLKRQMWTGFAEKRSWTFISSFSSSPITVQKSKFLKGFPGIYFARFFLPGIAPHLLRGRWKCFLQSFWQGGKNI